MRNEDKVARQVMLKELGRIQKLPAPPSLESGDASLRHASEQRDKQRQEFCESEEFIRACTTLQMQMLAFKARAANK